MYFSNAPELNQVTDFASHSPLPSTGITLVYSERLYPTDNDSKVKVRGLSDKQIESLKRLQQYSVLPVLTSSWTMNKAFGVVHREHWVIEEDGCARLISDDFEI